MIMFQLFYLESKYWW